MGSGLAFVESEDGASPRKRVLAAPPDLDATQTGAYRCLHIREVEGHDHPDPSAKMVNPSKHCPRYALPSEHATAGGPVGPVLISHLLQNRI